MSKQYLSIGEAAALTGSSVDTLRYYERIALLKDIPRDSGGRRYYRKQDMQSLGFIRRAQGLGFSLDDIRELMTLRESPKLAKAEVRALAQEKWRLLKQKVDELEALQAELGDMIQACEHSDNSSDCPIISGLEQAQ